VRTAQKAEQVALETGNRPLAADIAQRLELYKTERPFRDQ